MLFPCSESQPLECLQSPTVVGSISPHERCGYLGTSTPVSAEGGSTGRHSRLDFTEPVTAFFPPNCASCGISTGLSLYFTSGSTVPSTVTTLPAGALSKISRRSCWSFLDDLDTKHGGGDGDCGIFCDGCGS